LTPHQMETEALDLMLQGFHCSQAILTVGLKKLNVNDSEALVRSVAALGGGIASTGGPCGPLTGGIVCIGRAFGKTAPEEKDHPLMWRACTAFYRRFEAEVSGPELTVACRDIAGVDWRDRDQVQAFRGREGCTPCARLTGKAAAILGEILEKYAR